MNYVTVALAVLLIPMLVGLCAHLLAGLLGLTQQLASLFRAPRRSGARRPVGLARARAYRLRPAPSRPVAGPLPLSSPQSSAAGLGSEPHGP